MKRNSEIVKAVMTPQSNLTHATISVENEYGTSSISVRLPEPAQTDEPIEISIENFKFKSPFVCQCEGFYEEIKLAVPPRPEDARFADSPLYTTSYNDGQGNRDRSIDAYIYCRNNIYNFTGAGSSTDNGTAKGRCLVTSSDYTKNGKWSNTTFGLTIAAGFKFTSKMSDFSSGNKIDNLDSLQSMAADLGIVGCSDAAIKRFLQLTYPRTWYRFCDFQEARESLYDNGVNETVEYQFDSSRGTRRQGDRHLFVNGELWHKTHNPMPELVVIKAHVRDTYTLLISADAEIEELYEWNYGDDSLETRGYVFETDKWVKKEVKGMVADNPFAALVGKF